MHANASPSAKPAAGLLRGVAVALVLTLAACSGGSEPGDLAAARTPLVHNDPYPNVAADPSRAATQPRSSAEVQQIQNRMMSLAAEQGNASRAAGPQPTSVVDQMKALARRNQSLAKDGDQPAPDGVAAQPAN
jgi:hypothetical protein